MRRQPIDSGRAVSIATLGNALQRNLGLDRPVIDKTNLKDELFDFHVQAAMEVPDSTPAGGAASTPFNARELIFRAVQQQLGLKLESATAPSEVFVVDSVQKPSAN
jgi:uncharacterized protein (TIGR03435 family)